jgi:hypothetical protein
LGDVGPRSNRQERRHEILIEHDSGTDAEERGAAGGRGCRVGAHAQVRTSLDHGVRQAEATDLMIRL